MAVVAAVCLSIEGVEWNACAELAPEMTAAVDQQQCTKVQVEIAPDAEPTPEPTPEPRLAGLKIGIDPGHQAKGNSEREPVSPGSKETKAKVSSGTTSCTTGTPEHVVNLNVALQLRDALEAEGAEVLMTRDVAEVDISNVERAQMMNEWGADLVLRLHCNGVSKKSANGIGLYVRKTGTLADECLSAAETIIPHMIEQTGARKDGVFRRDTYSGLNWSEVPCVLVEMGYMTNAEEDALLNTPEYQQKLVQGMLEGIADYFERGEYATEAEYEAWSEDSDELSWEEILGE